MDLYVRYGSNNEDVEVYTCAENTFYQDPSVPKVMIRDYPSGTLTYGIAETYTHPYNKEYTYSVYDVQGYNHYTIKSWVESAQSVAEQIMVIQTQYINENGFPCYDGPAGAEYSLSGTAITTYDKNSKLRIRYGTGANDFGMLATYKNTFTEYNVISTQQEDAESCSSYATNRSFIPNFSSFEQPYTYLGLNHVVNTTTDGVTEYSTFTTGTQNVLERVSTNYTALYPQITVSFSRDHIGASNSGTISYTIGYQPYNMTTSRLAGLSNVFNQVTFADLKYTDLPQAVKDDIEADKTIYYTLNQTLTDSCIASDLSVTGEQTWSTSLNITQWFPTGSTLFTFSHSLSDATSIRSTWDLYYGMDKTDHYTFSLERDTQTIFTNTRSHTTRPSFASGLQETTAMSIAYSLTRPFREYQNIPNITTTDKQFSTMEVGGTGTVPATTTIFKQSSYEPGIGILYNAQTWCGLPAGYWQAGALGHPAFGIMTALSQRADDQTYRNSINNKYVLQSMFDKSISVTAYDYFSWSNYTDTTDKSSGYYPVITIGAAAESLPVLNDYISHDTNFIYDWMSSYCTVTNTMEMVTGGYAPMRSLVSASSDLTQFNHPSRKTSGLMTWGWPYQFKSAGAQGDYYNSPWGVFGAWGNGSNNHKYWVTWRRHFSFSFPELSISGTSLLPRWEWSVDLENDQVTSTTMTSLTVEPSYAVTRSLSATRWPYGVGPGSSSYSGSISGDPIYPYSMSYGAQIVAYTTATSTYSSVTEPLVKDTHTAFVNESTYTCLNTYKIFTDGAVDETYRPVSVSTQAQATYHTCNNIGFVTNVPQTVTQTISLYRCGKTNSTATDAPFDVFDEHTYLGLQGGAPYELGSDSVKFFLGYGLVHDDYWLEQDFTVPYSVTDTARISDIWTSYGNTTEAGKPYWSVPVKYTYNGSERDIEWLEFMTKNMGTVMVSDCMKYGTWFPDTTESTDYNGVFSWKTNSAYFGHWSNFTDATWESTDHTYFETYSQTTTI